MVTDTLHMGRALALAERGRGRTSPNPMVGAVVVDPEGIVVGRGSHAAAGGPHAEIHAFAAAGDRARGATLYCTLEPCSHTGRTGPCAPRVVAAGIRRAVIAIEDPNPLVRGRGLAHLREHGVCIVFSSHLIHDVSALCDTVVIISRGRTVAQGEPEDLCRQTRCRTLEEAFMALTGHEQETTCLVG